MEERTSKKAKEEEISEGREMGNCRTEHMKETGTEGTKSKRKKTLNQGEGEKKRN